MERQLYLQWTKERQTVRGPQEGAKPVNKGKPGGKLEAGKETVPGMGLRHLASWAGAAVPGRVSPGEQAGRVRGRWQQQLARLAMHRMWRMPAACPGTSPSGSKCLAGGRSRQATPGRPSHLLPSEQGSGPGLGRQKEPGQRLHHISRHGLSYLGITGRRPPKA